MIFGFKMNSKDESPLISNFDQLETNTAPVGQIEELIRFVETKYVDEVNREELISSAISAVLNNLDPHSIYIDPDRLERLNEDMNGSFSGIGIETFYLEDTVNIIRTVIGGPAHKSGIKPYDKLLTINDNLIAGQGLEFSEIEDMIRGKQGDKLSIGVLSKDGSFSTKEINIGKIPLKSVDIAFNISDDIGYIKINRFSSTTYKEFMDKVEEMNELGVKNMIIDLRGNPGGYLPEATNILSQLFGQKGNLLVYTEGRNDKKLEYKTTGKPFFQIDMISVLIDENSASGSEIIAGAVQDWDRGIVIGRRSFGKGLVQEQYELGNGGAIRLTVARYYTPSGRSIQKEYDDFGEYENDIYDRIDDGEMFSSDSIDVKGKMLYNTKVLNRTVFGGGGITPDAFIPIDSIELKRDYLELSQGVNQFVFKKLKNEKIEPTDDNLERLLNTYVNNVDDLIISDTIKQQLKIDIKQALIYYQNGELAMYKYILSKDPFIDKSIQYFEGKYKLEDHSH